MNLLPYETWKQSCPACGTGQIAGVPLYKFEYCEGECMIGRAPGSPYVDGTTMNTPGRQSHLHITCRQCGLERIIETAGEVKR